MLCDITVHGGPGTPLSKALTFPIGEAFLRNKELICKYYQRKDKIDSGHVWRVLQVPRRILHITITQTTVKSIPGDGLHGMPDGKTLTALLT